MSWRRPVHARLLGAAALLLALGGCGDSPEKQESTSPAETSQETSAQTPAETSSGSPEETETSAPATSPRPRTGQCHALSWDAVLAPVPEKGPTACRKKHTAETFFVGRLDVVQGSHRLAVDSPAVQAQPERACTGRLAEHLGVSPGDLRLTMAQTVWFTPSVDDAGAGADWFRCDVVVVAAPETLLPLPRRSKGLGDAKAVAMCATAEPGTKGFTRVACARKHSWRAVSTVDLPGRKFPAPKQIAARMDPACRAAARARADDPLDFRWSQEGPTQERWDAGRTYGICWIPA